MKQYKKYVIPYKSAFILGPIFMIVEVLGEIILPKLMSMIINYGCGQDVTVAAKGPAYWDRSSYDWNGSSYDDGWRAWCLFCGKGICKFCR